MVDYGTVTSVKIDNFLGSKDQYIVVEVQLTDDQDMVSCLWLPGAGRQQYPWKGDLVSLVFANQNWGIAVAASDHIAVDIGQGEQKIYSYDESRTIRAFINLLADGVLEFNGNSKSLVTYAELVQGLSNYNGAALPPTGVQGEFAKIAIVLQSLAPGSYTPGVLSVDISAAETSTIKVG